ncbi:MULTISPECIES: DUF6343 family protein [unclassified Streptomyces]|uniref:DUF6343 family protein n=1 Tax=unclassified Streptomyces TaxID=2593676 RepID=UPI003D733277
MTDRHPYGSRADVSRRRDRPSVRRRPRTGTEPITARSALGLRLLLASVFFPVFTAAAVGFGFWSAASDAGDSPSSGVLTGVTVVCAVLALLTAVDLLVITRRLRRERAWDRNAGHTGRP